MILEGFAVATFGLTEFSKTQHYSLEEDSKEKILSDGLYHFTSKDAAEKIMKDGFLRPSKGRIRNHMGKDKVYMFAGMPDVDNFAKNLPARLNPFISGNLEFYAVKVNPDEQELHKFKERLQDSAIVYEGRYDIGNKGRAVELVVDIDNSGKCTFREKTEEEIQNGYMPSEELLKYIEDHKISKNFSAIRLLGMEVKFGMSSIPKMPKRVYRDFKDKVQRRKEAKEFEKYSFNMNIKDSDDVENLYNVNCDKLEFYGDKKLNRVNIEKVNKQTGEKDSYRCYADGHLLNLGDESAAMYIQKIEEASQNGMLNKINGIDYIGQPMLDTEEGRITIGVDAKFNEMLRERNRAEELGNITNKSYDIFNNKKKEYYNKHPFKRIMEKLTGKAPKRLESRDNIGKYTNNKLDKVAIENIETRGQEDNSFVANKKCEISYKEGSDYTVLLGDTVYLDGKLLRKIMISEENYLNKNAMDTVKLPQNYYIEEFDVENVNKKDLAKLFSTLGRNQKKDDVKIENNGFVGTYLGGVNIDKKGKVKGMTYDSTLKEKYGQNINIDKDEDSLDMSEYVNTEEVIKENYSKGNELKEIEKDMEKEL